MGTGLSGVLCSPSTAPLAPPGEGAGRSNCKGPRSIGRHHQGHARAPRGPWETVWLMPSPLCSFPPAPLGNEERGYSLGLQRGQGLCGVTSLNSKGAPFCDQSPHPYLLGCCPGGQAGPGSPSTLLSWAPGTCLPSSPLLLLLGQTLRQARTEKRGGLGQQAGFSALTGQPLSSPSLELALLCLLPNLTKNVYYLHVA